MLWLFPGQVIYFLAGGVFFWYADRREMREHVPYGEFPSYFRLNQIRFGCLLFCLLFGGALMSGLLLRDGAKWAYFRTRLSVSGWRLDWKLRNRPELRQLVRQIRKGRD